MKRVYKPCSYRHYCINCRLKPGLKQRVKPSRSGLKDRKQSCLTFSDPVCLHLSSDPQTGGCYSDRETDSLCVRHLSFCLCPLSLSFGPVSLCLSSLSLSLSVLSLSVSGFVALNFKLRPSPFFHFSRESRESRESFT